MSISGSVGLTAIIWAKVAMATGSIAYMVLACLLVALASDSMKGLLAAYVNVPFFIVTIVIGRCSCLRAGGDGHRNRAVCDPNPHYRGYDVDQIITLSGYYLAGLLLFNLHKDRQESGKLIGGNEVAARQSGINIESTKIIAFLIAAVGVALAATIILLAGMKNSQPDHRRNDLHRHRRWPWRWAACRFGGPCRRSAELCRWGSHHHCAEQRTDHHWGQHRDDQNIAA